MGKPAWLFERSKLILIAIAALCGLFSTTARADGTIFATGFEPAPASPPYVLGPLFNADSGAQNDWSVSVFSAEACIIQNTIVKSGTQALELDASLADGPAGASHPVAYSSTGTDKFLDVSVDAYLSSSGTSSYWAVIGEVFDNGYFTVSVSETRHLIVSNDVTSTDTGVVVTPDAWHHYEVLFDFMSHTATAYYDGVLVQASFAFNEMATSASLFEVVNQGGGSDQAYFDNVLNQSLTLSPPIITTSFGASSIPLNNGTSFIISVYNPNTTGLSGVSYTDTYPAGLSVPTLNGATLNYNCPGFNTTGTSSSELMITNISLGPGITCTLTATIIGIAAGVQNNTTGPVSSSQTGTGNASNTATLTVVDPPSISKSFSPATIALNGSSALSFTITNPNAATTLTGVSFNDTFPNGLVALDVITGTCGGGTIKSDAGSASASLSGATLAGGASCTFSVGVTGTMPGMANNSVQVTSSNGGTGNTATASLNVTATYTVTPSVNGGNGTISPSTAQTVNYDTTQSFTLTPNPGYSIGTVGGTCPAGTLSGSTYTTGAVTGNCTVIANFTINTYTVTPSVNGGNGTISPSTEQTVNYDTTQSFTLTPNTGYSIGAIGGTCPPGTLSGSTYTTGAVTGSCSVIANFTINTYTVTPSVGTGSGMISPNTAQTVNYDTTQSFTLTPSTGYSIGTVGGTCPAGTLSGSIYTTGAVTGSCTVIANFTINTYTVTPSVNGGNGTISPSTVQTVNYDTTQSFTLTPNTGYSIGAVGGTCPAGTLSGSTYTTGAVTGNCTVIANFTINTYTVTPSVGTGSGMISPNTAQTVNYDTTQSFTLTPNTGYHIASVTGTCGGTLNTNMYTTAAVTSSCSVIANFAINTYTVTPSVVNVYGSITPNTVQTVDYGGTSTFTMTANPGYVIASTGGTCGGSLVGSLYTTNPVTANCTVVLTIGHAPAITSANNATFQTGMAGSFQVKASGIPTVMNFAETGSLPSGVTLNPTSGLLSGIPAAGTGGVYTITVVASNGISPNATQTFTLTVDQPPAITSAEYATFVKGRPGSFTVTTTGYPVPTLSYLPNGTSLPAGVTFTPNSNGTATISGTPTVSGVFAFFIKATNGVGSGTLQSFTLTVKAHP